MSIDKKSDPVIEWRRGEGYKGNQKKTGHNGTTARGIMLLVVINGTGKRSFYFAVRAARGRHNGPDDPQPIKHLDYFLLTVYSPGSSPGDRETLRTITRGPET